MVTSRADCWKNPSVHVFTMPSHSLPFNGTMPGYTKRQITIFCWGNFNLELNRFQRSNDFIVAMLFKSVLPPFSFLDYSSKWFHCLDERCYARRSRNKERKQGVPIPTESTYSIVFDCYCRGKTWIPQNWSTIPCLVRERIWWVNLDRMPDSILL